MTPIELKERLSAGESAVKVYDLVSDDEVSEEMLLHLIRAKRGGGTRVFDLIPEKQITEALCYAVIETDAKCGVGLESVSHYPKFVTPDICRYAVKQDPSAAAVASHLLPKMVEEFMAIDYRSFRYIPDELKTFDICEEAIREDAVFSLGSVPRDVITPELCELAVSINPLALGAVPEGLRTDALCAEAVKRNGLTLAFVPSVKITRELCFAAVSNNPNSFMYVPENLMDAELCEEAVRGRFSNIHFIPADKRTQKMEEIALDGIKRFGDEDKA